MPQSIVADASETLLKKAGETLGEAKKALVSQTKDVTTQVREQINYFGFTEPPPDEVTEREEEEEIMRQMKGYKEKLMEIDRLLGVEPDEKALEEKVASWAEKEKAKKEKNRLFQSYRNMKTNHEHESPKLGQTPQDQQEPTYEQKQAELAQEKEQKDIAQQSSMNQEVGSNSKTSGGVFGKRPKARMRMQPIRTSENKMGQANRE